MPDGGGILRADWFNAWKQKEEPQYEFILQSWDTAITSKITSAHSACTTWGVFRDNQGIPNIMLLSLYHGQIEYPDLRKMMVRLANNYYDTDLNDPYPTSIQHPSDLVLIEEKATGHLLLSDVSASSIPISRFNPTKYGDKRGRCRIASQFIENGRVWLPTTGPTYQHLSKQSQILLESASLFPGTLPGKPTSDIIDSMSQALIRLRDDGWMYNKVDAPTEESIFKGASSYQPYY